MYPERVKLGSWSHVKQVGRKEKEKKKKKRSPILAERQSHHEKFPMVDLSKYPNQTLFMHIERY
jgi:hypothetical protein